MFQPEIEVVEVVEVPELEDGKPKLDKAGKPIMRKEPKTVKRPRMKKIEVVRPKLGADKTIEVQEKSALSDFGIRTYNLSIVGVSYDSQVEEQIKEQQQATMAIQTQMAKAKEAEQLKLTVEKQGESNAAKAKWEQEVKKAQAITEAQQKKEVATLDLEAARLQANAQIERAKGEAEARKLVMEADGALEKKLSAYIEIQKAYAAEIGKQRWVPDVQIGNTGNGANPAVGLMELLQVKAAKDLALDW